MKPVLTVLALVLLPGFAAPAWAQGPQMLPETTLRQWQDAFNARDADALVALYEEDGRLLPPYDPVKNGRKEMHALWSYIFGLVRHPPPEKHPPLRTLTTPLTETLLGDIALQVVGFRLVNARDEELESGKYLHVWVKRDSQWRLQQSMWNFNELPHELCDLLQRMGIEKSAR